MVVQGYVVWFSRFWIFQFSFCQWYHIGQKRYLVCFQFLKLAKACFVTAHMICVGVCLCMLLLWSGMFYICLLDPFGLTYSSRTRFPYWFLSDLSIVESGALGVPYCYCIVVCFFLCICLRYVCGTLLGVCVRMFMCDQYILLMNLTHLSLSDNLLCFFFELLS